jgi:hypothetical protein
MPSRLAVSILVPVLAFSATLAILYYQQGGIGRHQPGEEAPAGGGGPPAPGSMAAVQEPPAQPPQLAAAAPTAPTATPGKGDDASAKDLPLRFLARPAQAGEPMIATLMNMTGETLPVTVTAVNAKTHLRSVVQVSILPHQRKNLSTEGLSVSDGDQVTLESPPFRDQTIQVP